MFKDLISLQRENEDKNHILQQLSTLNLQLKHDFEQCKDHNQQLEVFLKEVEFTFQPERKKPQTSQILLKAKRTLHQEAKEAQDKMKKMFKNSDSSNIQEVKVYIATLEHHKEQLKTQIQLIRNTVEARSKHQDFNVLQTHKFHKACKRVRVALDHELHHFTKNQQRYRIDKMTVKGKVKERNLQTEKRHLKEST